MDISDTLDIAAPAAILWDLETDIEGWPTVLPTVTSAKRLDAGPLRVGSTARIEQPGLKPAVWTVTELEPGKRFAWWTSLFGVRTDAIHSIEPSGDGATNTLTLRLHGWRGRVLGTLLGGRMRDTIALENRAFREAALATAGSGATPQG